MAPLEGLTSYLYRQVYQQEFHNIDKYFTPFIAPHTKRSLNTREKKEILPENNKGLNVVPQILTNNAQDFLMVAQTLKDYGYQEVNLNIGCPSPTVTTKKKGAGILGDINLLDSFLGQLFWENDNMKISIKTRIGVENEEDFPKIVEIFNKYPIDELIIHPRVQKDFYKGNIRIDAFSYAYENCKIPLIFNGDIFSESNADEIYQKFPNIKGIMIGRGLLANPGLVGKILMEDNLTQEKLKKFHDDILNGYKEWNNGDKNVLYKMKELWSYMGFIFPNYDAYKKKINKCERCIEYEQIINILFLKESIDNSRAFQDKPMA